jgi:hypothetical protein
MRSAMTWHYGTNPLTVTARCADCGGPLQTWSKRWDPLCCRCWVMRSKMLVEE